MFVDKVDKVKGDGVVLVAVVSSSYDWRDRGWFGGGVRGLNRRLDVEIGRMELRLKRKRETLNGRRVLRMLFIMIKIE